MSPNSVLSIAIPTYNRCEFLDYSLSIHIPFLRKYCIPIYVSDNASSDGTQAMVQRWQKEYPLLYYSRNKNNLGFDKNFEKSLMLPETDYVWLLGDSYLLPEIAISWILESSKSQDLNKVDVFVFNLNSKLAKPTKAYNECNKVLIELSGIMSCVSCNVFSKEVLLASEFSRFYDSSFLHTGILFDTVSKFESIYIDWNKEINLKTISHKSKKSWATSEKALDIGLCSWINLIYSLPVKYSLYSKRNAAQSFGEVSGFLTVKGLLVLRANRRLGIKEIFKYRHEFNVAIPLFSFRYFMLYVVCMIPSNLLLKLINLLSKYSRS